MLARQQVMRKQTTTEKFVIQRLQTAPLLGKKYFQSAIVHRMKVRCLSGLALLRSSRWRRGPFFPIPVQLTGQDLHQQVKVFRCVSRAAHIDISAWRQDAKEEMRG